MSRAAAAAMPSDAVVAADRPGFDLVLLAAVLGLTVIGIVMVYSSSAVFAGSRYGDGAFFLKRQAVATVGGILAMAFILRVGYRRLEVLAWPLIVLSALLVAATLIPGVGTRAGGAQRWIRFPGFQFQPSELAKLAICLWLASSVARKGETIKDFRTGFLPHALVVGFFALLVMGQPDFGTLVVFVCVLLLVLFVAGARMRYVVFAVVAAAPVLYWLVATSEYRMRRIKAFLDPFSDRFGRGYQVVESLMSVGSGGVFGLGLGEGRQKLGFLPAGHTDYILASIGEELGLAGIFVTLALFAVVLWRGLRAARRASEPFGAHLAFAVTALLAVEISINAGMCLGLLPSKGLALPFLSYGGTQMFKSLVAAALLLSVSGGGGGYLVPAAGAVRCR